MRGLAFVTCLLALLAAASGCAPQAAPPPPLAKVSGKVKLDGQPMAVGKIYFHVQAGGAREIDVKDGEFSGEAHVGKNHVQVVLQKEGPPATTDKKEPTKINAVAPSDISADVTKDGTNAFTFDVTSAR